MANFSAATNFDEELLTFIEESNKKHSNQVTEIYGSLPVSIVGSARAQKGLPRITREGLSNHIRLAHDKGIKFNYPMNASSGINLDDTSYACRVNEELTFLLSAGIDSLTVADDALINFIRKEHPEIELHLSIVKGVSAVDAIKKYADQGIKVITLNQHTVNREFKCIEKLVRSFPDSELRIYANVSCLSNCSKRDEHYRYLSQQSQSGNAPSNKPDLFIVNCALTYLKNPTEILKSPFIRPEDIQAYEQLGIKTFKLSDRREPTQDLANLIRAYLKGEFHGNLFNFLFRSGRKWTNSFTAIGLQCVPTPSIFIDNDELGRIQFLDKIRNLNGDELEAFYREATARALRVSNEQTEKFKLWMQRMQSAQSFINKNYSI